MCGGGGVKIGGTAGQLIGGLEKETKKAVKGAQGELNKLSGGGSKGGGKGSSIGKLGTSSDIGKVSFPKMDFGEIGKGLSAMKAPTITPPVVKAPEVNLPSVNIPKPAPVPSLNMDQDLTKVSTKTVQDAAISAASDVQAGVIKAGSDVQDLAIKTGSDVQQGVIDITSQTGVSNPTLENIISSNVEGTEQSLQTIVKGAEDELSKNVGGLEGSIENIVGTIESLGTLLTGGTGGGGNGGGDTGGQTQDQYYTPPDNTKPSPLPGPQDAMTARTFSEEERKRADRILQASRYGRRNTMLTGGSGLTNFGV